MYAAGKAATHFQVNRKEAVTEVALQVRQAPTFLKVPHTSCTYLLPAQVQRGERVCSPTRDSRSTHGLSRALQSDPCPLPPRLFVSPSQVSIPFFPVAGDVCVAVETAEHV